MSFRFAPYRRLLVSSVDNPGTFLLRSTADLGSESMTIVASDLFDSVIAEALAVSSLDKHSYNSFFECEKWLYICKFIR